jgi:2-alkyl-3-oxoalkanoate reductase
MPVRVLVAGATGVVGTRIAAQLVGLGHDVAGLSRTGRPLPGVDMVACDVLDRDQVRAVMRSKAPDVVVHMLTSLPTTLTQADTEARFAANDRIREIGTRNLLLALQEAGAGRVVAQSIAFGYAPEGPMVVTEDARLWTDAPEPWGRTVRAVATLEHEVLASRVDAAVLRFGTLYGPGTWWAPDGDLTKTIRQGVVPLVEPGGGTTSFLHVADAADGAVLAAAGTATGVFNIADNDPARAADWLPELARTLGAPQPPHMDLEEARRLLDPQTIHRQTQQRGADNKRARFDLGWAPRHPSWRDHLGR